MTPAPPPSPATRRHLRALGIVTVVGTLGVVLAASAVASLSMGSSSHSGDVADPGGLIGGAIVLVLLAVAAVIVIVAIAIGRMQYTARRGAVALSALVAVACGIVGSSGFTAAVGSPALELVSIAGAVYSAVAGALLLPLLLEYAGGSSTPVAKVARLMSTAKSLWLSVILTPVLGAVTLTPIAFVKRAAARENAARLDSERKNLADVATRVVAYGHCASSNSVIEFCGAVDRIGITSNGAHALAAVAGRTVVWDLATHEKVASPQANGQVVRAVPSATIPSRFVACDHGSCAMFDDASKPSRSELSPCDAAKKSYAIDVQSVPQVDIGRDARLLVTAGQSMCVYDVTTRALVRRIGEPCVTRYSAVALNAASTMAASLCEHDVAIFDVATGSKKNTFSVGPGARAQKHLVFTSDGLSLVLLTAGSNAETIHVVNVATGTETRSFAVGPSSFGNLHSFALLADDRRLLVGGTHLCAWNIQDGTRIGCSATPADDVASPNAADAPVLAVSSVQRLDLRQRQIEPTVKIWTENDIAEMK